MIERDGAKSASTLSVQVYESLCQRMLAGELYPGAKLSLRSLATGFGTSMQPVRDAVSSLVAEEALEITPARVIQVPPLDRTVCDGIWLLRSLTEGEAAALFAQHAPEADFHSLQGLTEAVRRAYRGGNVSEHMLAFQDWSFFIAERCGSPMLAALIRRLRVRNAPIIALALSADVPDEPVFMEFSTHIMEELALAVRTRDPGRVRDLRRVDILTYQRYLYARLGWKLE
ncbi:GntR family transcriptional regulator [Bosea sp. BH3]|uniref:GntR family transcriptional regulator n=1 Tax=Bosea sp. BH3 TaxID=2871701 RepID=UPI0021CB6FFB|nr:GntR family transcriptional regulator [Bosea sp. BH3]MCU4178245.1 GntR family transcriptional regulator [Bosea sp. BH3]